MKNKILQSSLVFGFLYSVSIMIAPSLEVVIQTNSSKLVHDAFYRLVIFSILASIYYLMSCKALKIESGAKMALVISMTATVLIIDLISWYFIGIYEYQGSVNFIFMYLMTLPIVGGFTFFVSIFIAEFIWKKVKTN